MKTKVYNELKALKKKLREEKITYRSLSRDVNISVDALNSKLNGYTDFTRSEIMRIAKCVNINSSDIVKYFFSTVIT